MNKSSRQSHDDAVETDKYNGKNFIDHSFSKLPSIIKGEFSDMPGGFKNNQNEERSLNNTVYIKCNEIFVQDISIIDVIVLFTYL